MTDAEDQAEGSLLWGSGGDEKSGAGVAQPPPNKFIDSVPEQHTAAGLHLVVLCEPEVGGSCSVLTHITCEATCGFR